MPLVDRALSGPSPRCSIDRSRSSGTAWGRCSPSRSPGGSGARYGKEPVHLFVLGRGAPHVPRRTPDSAPAPGRAARHPRRRCATYGAFPRWCRRGRRASASAIPSPALARRPGQPRHRWRRTSSSPAQSSAARSACSAAIATRTPTFRICARGPSRPRRRSGSGCSKAITSS